VGVSELSTRADGRRPKSAKAHEIAGSGALTAQRALLEIERCTETSIDFDWLWT
jgi:hypothetical protein